MIHKLLQNELNKCLMLCFISRIYEDIVKVTDNAKVQKFLQDFIHHDLESRWGIGEAHRHNKVFKMSIPSLKSSFSFFSLCYANEVVASLEIDLGEYIGSLNSIPKLIH